MVLPLEDREVSQELERALIRRGIRVMTKACFQPTAVRTTDHDVCLMVGPEGKPQEQIRAERLLVAKGRAGNVEDIGLETTEVEVDRGVVKVDHQMRTAEPHVYAIGDVCGGLQLAHVAARERFVAVVNIAGANPPEVIDYDHQPRATFTRPQVASIGLTEQQCEERGIAATKGNFPFVADTKAVIVGETEGFAEVIADAKTDEILGIHFIGPSVTDVIAEGAVAMTLEATASEVAASTHPHPTLVEALGEAAMAVDGRQINA
ncbi:MAG: FAD-dependent oxidoreductase [Candidatus Limnocylindrales bacterium]